MRDPLNLGIISLFPEMFNAISNFGITSRALKNKLVTLEFFNPRDYAYAPYFQVDDRPYGGGPGMVLKPEPIVQAINAAKAIMPGATVIYLSPQGERLNQARVRDLTNKQALILLAGRYEGIDERVLAKHVDYECSVGDYILSGGELAQMVLADAIIRLIPGALGCGDSSREDSFESGLLDCPHYTRPEVFDGRGVPDILLSGDHAKIKKWRLQQALGATFLKRPDIFAGLKLTKQELELLNEYLADNMKE